MFAGVQLLKAVVRLQVSMELSLAKPGAEEPSDPKGLFTPPTLICRRSVGRLAQAVLTWLANGPELFVPGAQGNIVPNNAMGGLTSW